MKFKKILVNNKENLEFLNSLEKIYMVGYWAHYGTRDFPFIGKFENKSGYYFPIVYHYNDYNDLEKIYSIWVCNKGIPKELQNTISKYSFSKTDLLGKTNEPEEDFDLMDIVIIRRGATAPNENDLLQYLEGVFTSDLHKMCKYIDIQENSEMEKEVKSMTGLGQTIAETNYAKGIEKGEESKTKIVVKNLLARGMSDEDIMVLAECSKEMVEQVRNNIE